MRPLALLAVLVTVVALVTACESSTECDERATPTPSSQTAPVVMEAAVIGRPSPPRPAPPRPAKPAKPNSGLGGTSGYIDTHDCD
ncbi:hypothetical protein ACWF94_36925 [Streptomyces sp. NPDC055078]